MDAMPLRWQSASRVEALRRLVGERVEQWSAQWFAAPARVPHTLDTLAASKPESVNSDIHWYRLRDGEGALHLRTIGRAVEHLGCKLAGLAVADEAGLADGIGRRALTDLAHRFVGPVAQVPLEALHSVPEAAVVGPRHGAIGLQLGLGAIRIELYFDAALSTALLPAARTQTVALVPRAQALGSVDARFDAVLDLGRLALADTPALRAGEVLKTSVPLAHGLRLLAADGRCVLSGRLAAEDGRKALQVIELHRNR